MKRLYKIGWCLLVYFAAVCPAHAGQDSTGIYVRQILKPQAAEVRSLAINRLIALQQPACFPLLEAINGSSLYMYHGKEVTLGGKTAGSDDHYMVYEVYPERLPLTDGKGQPLILAPSDLDRVEIGRADRLLLSPISNWLNVFDADVQRRTLAYGQLPDTAGAADLGILAAALQTETDPGALRAGRESYYAMQLNNARDNGVARAYIDSLYANEGDNASRVLHTYAKRSDKPEGISRYAGQRADALDDHYTWLQRFQNLFSGLSLGSILILVSLGLAIVYGLAGIINMAHGEFLMIGAYTAYCMGTLFTGVLHVQNGNWFYAAALPASFVVAGSAGLILERLVIRKLYAKPLESLLATWGVSLILIQTARMLFGDLTAVKPPPLLSGGWQIAPHLVLPYNRLFIIGLTFFIVSLLYWLLFRTRLGMQIRAVTQNRAMSACLGINTRRVDAITFFIGSGLAGLAGCAMTLIGNVVPDMGQTYIVDSFLVVVTGGVGKLVGTIAAGLGIGVFSKVLEAFFEAVYGKVLILLCIMLFLQFKPKGLFPDKGRVGED